MEANGIESVAPLVVRKTTAGKMLECGTTKIWQLVRAGKLKTIKIGADERILVASIRHFVDSGGDHEAKA